MPDSPLDRALLSLEGLSVGDAFGELFLALPFAEVRTAVAARQPPPEPVWRITDDTLMAIGLVETLAAHGEVHETSLACGFGRHFHPDRGFGRAMFDLLPALYAVKGEGWKTASQAVFDGAGSCGNGSAMRVAPLGAFFADDLPRLAREAERSALVTHAHPEAVAGACAVALAAALAWRSRELAAPPSPASFLAAVHAAIPDSEVRDGLARAIDLPPDTLPVIAAVTLGNGSRVTCQDTVPYVLWSAATSLGNYEEALWRTVAGGGDKDTTCAIVGGIVALRTGLDSIPPHWRQRREPLGSFLDSSLAARLPA